MPVRQIPRSHRSITGVIAATKARGPAASESSLERDLLLVLEFSALVARYEVQPVRIAYQDGTGCRRTYTPDVLITPSVASAVPAPPSGWTMQYPPERHGEAPRILTPRQRPMLCEVKYTADLRVDPKTMRRNCGAARDYARERGWTFRVVTERDIRTPFLHNARFFLPYRHTPHVPDIAESVCQEAHGVAIHRLLVSLGGKPYRHPRVDLAPHLWRLMATHQIVTDACRPVTLDTRVCTSAHYWSARQVDHMPSYSEPSWLCDPHAPEPRLHTAAHGS